MSWLCMNCTEREVDAPYRTCARCAEFRYDCRLFPGRRCPFCIPLPPETRDDCQTCRYWHKTNLYDQGECRRHAPVMNTHAAFDSPAACWPITLTSHWCGDFARKEPHA